MKNKLIATLKDYAIIPIVGTGLIIITAVALLIYGYPPGMPEPVEGFTGSALLARPAESRLIVNGRRYRSLQCKKVRADLVCKLER